MYFTKIYDNENLDKLIRILYEVNTYNLWFPGVKESKNIKNITKTKGLVYVNFDFDTIKDRDLLLFYFVNNNLKENKSLQFILTSAEDLSFLEKEKYNNNKNDVVTMNLMKSLVEIELLNDESFKLNVLFQIDPKFVKLDSYYLQIIMRIAYTKLFEKIDELLKLSKVDFNKKIPKSNDTKFYEFINNELKLASLTKPKIDY